MRKITLLISTLGLLAFSGMTFASPVCTQELKSKWMSELKMQDQVKQAGYKVKVFKTTGSCYEIYGWDKAGKRAEVYFNPVNGNIVKKG
jgi:hypothetical protein